MKLKNKKTGEIGELSVWCKTDDGEVTSFAVLMKNEKFPVDYNSLAELNAEWEDYEEPKEYWYIDWTPEIGVYHTRDVDSDADKRQKQIGNYFETKEEAKKAVEKLKAFKRLKDKGFKFVRVDGVERVIYFEIPYRVGYDSCEAEADLDSCFGGGE